MKSDNSTVKFIVKMRVSLTAGPRYVVRKNINPPNQTMRLTRERALVVGRIFTALKKNIYREKKKLTTRTLLYYAFVFYVTRCTV